MISQQSFHFFLKCSYFLLFSCHTVYMWVFKLFLSNLIRKATKTKNCCGLNCIIIARSLITGTNSMGDATLDFKWFILRKGCRRMIAWILISGWKLKMAWAFYLILLFPDELSEGISKCQAAVEGRLTEAFSSNNCQLLFRCYLRSDHRFSQYYTWGVSRGVLHGLCPNYLLGRCGGDGQGRSCNQKGFPSTMRFQHLDRTGSVFYIPDWWLMRFVMRDDYANTRGVQEEWSKSNLESSSSGPSNGNQQPSWFVWPTNSAPGF